MKLMGQKNKKTQPCVDRDGNPVLNHIASGTHITGTLTSDFDIRIDGTVEGDVISKSKLIIGTEGVVNGTVKCFHIELSGKIIGDVQADEMLIVCASGKLDGNVCTGKLEIEMGGQLNGRSTMLFEQGGQDFSKKGGLASRQREKEEGINRTNADEPLLL
jgi:cytoskeletal protein CcmA (bactofilin family)